MEVLRAGICGTDLHLLGGYAGFRGIPGHEFVGVVEGRRVVAEINCPCKLCPLCRSGLGNHCPERKVLGIRGKNGAFAQKVALPRENLHELPSRMSDEQAVFVEPLAAAFRILEQVETGGRSLVLGDGRLGLLVAQLLPDVTVLSRRPSKQALLQGLGLPWVAASDQLEPDSFDLVVECSGAPALLDLALELVRPLGTVVLKSSWLEPSLLQASRLMVKEIRLQGSRCGPFLPAIEALAGGRVVVEPLIDRTFSLEEGLGAFQRAATPGVLKVLLRT